MTTLTAEEARVVGALAEKQLTTPQYYPLTLNALVAACNQSNNRDPVVSYDEATVQAAIASLREKGLARLVHPGSGSRATKYRQVLDEALGLDRRELALLCVMLLRGPQTVKEMAGRTERMTEFDDPAAISHDLERLASREPALVVNVGRRSGQREERYGTTLVDRSDVSDATPTAEATGSRPARPTLPRTPRLAPISAEEATPDQRELLAGVGVAANNLFATLVRHPGLFRRWLPFGGKLLQAGTLDRRLRELVILRTAHLSGAAYEWGHHVAIGRAAGLTHEEIARVGASSDGWSGLDAVVVRACDEVHRDGVISEETWRSLIEGLDERSAIEVPFLIGHYRMLAVVIASLGIQPEPDLPPLPSA